MGVLLYCFGSRAVVITITIKQALIFCRKSFVEAWFSSRDPQNCDQVQLSQCVFNAVNDNQELQLSYVNHNYP